MKKASLKKLVPIAIVIALLTLVTVWAITVSENNPADGRYIFDPAGNYNGSCEVMVSQDNWGYGWNITNTSVQIWNETASSWDIILVNNTVMTNNTSYNMTFAFAGEPDGQSYKWRCGACDINGTASGHAGTNVTCSNSTTSRNVYFETPPAIDFMTDTPADAGFVRYTNASLSWRVYSITNDDNLYFTCKIWYNNSDGDWVAYGTSYTAQNYTIYNTSFSFRNNQLTKYGIRCNEQGNDKIYNQTANRTIMVDTVAPVINSFLPANGDWRSSGSTMYFGLNVTEVNPANCSISTTMNTSTNVSQSGIWDHQYETVEEYTDSVLWYFQNMNGTTADNAVVWEDNNTGVYQWNVSCNDDAGNKVDSGLYNVFVDTVPPGITNVASQSAGNVCDVWEVNWTSTELNGTNFTIGFDSVTTNALGNISQTNFSLENVGNMSGYKEEEINYVNITVADRAGNVNNTFAVTEVTTPLGICAGWNWRAVLESSITLGSLFNNISGVSAGGADYVYYFNQTGQNWAWVSATDPSSENLSIVNGSAIAIYESDGSTWLRKDDGVPLTSIDINYSIFSADNFIGISNYTYTFYNFTDLGDDTIHGGMNMTYMAVYDNSDNTWGGNNSYYYGGLWANLTTFGKQQDREVVWVYSLQNSTWNGTAIFARLP